MATITNPRNAPGVTDGAAAVAIEKPKPQEPNRVFLKQMAAGTSPLRPPMGAAK